MDTRRHAPTSLAWSDSGLCPVIATETGRDKSQGCCGCRSCFCLGRIFRRESTLGAAFQHQWRS